MKIVVTCPRYFSEINGVEDVEFWLKIIQSDNPPVETQRDIRDGWVIIDFPRVNFSQSF